MSIDTLRKSDGSYSAASYRTIKSTVHAGHTEHLQTERGVAVFHPYTPTNTGRPGIMIDWRPTMADGTSLCTDKECEVFDLKAQGTDSIRWAYERLNGSLDTDLVPNTPYSVFANQAVREGCVLAVIGDEALIEYEMPGRHGPVTSALRIQRFIGDQPVGDYRSVSYHNVPKKWLAAIRAAGMTDWLGMGQRTTTRIPFPTNED